MQITLIYIIYSNFLSIISLIKTKLLHQTRSRNTRSTMDTLLYKNKKKTMATLQQVCVNTQADDTCIEYNGK